MKITFYLFQLFLIAFASHDKYRAIFILLEESTENNVRSFLSASGIMNYIYPSSQKYSIISLLFLFIYSFVFRTEFNLKKVMKMSGNFKYLEHFRVLEQKEGSEVNYRNCYVIGSGI